MGHFDSRAEAMEAMPLMAPTEIASNGWPHPRWAANTLGEDGSSETLWADTRAELIAYLADDPATLTPAETTQAGLADAVAEGLAEPAAPRAQRSDSPWTEERLALLRRLFPTTLTLEAIRQALAALPGLDLATPEAVRVKAQKLDLHRRGEPIPEEFADAAATRTRSIGGLANNGGKPGTWTEERLRILRRDYPGTRPMEDILAEVNSLPGPQVPSIGAVAAKAKTLDLRRRVAMAVGEPIAPEGGAAFRVTPPVVTLRVKALVSTPATATRTSVSTPGSRWPWPARISPRVWVRSKRYG
jgi:hypothetical protein